MNIFKRFLEMLFGECGEQSSATFSQMKAMAATLNHDQLLQAREDRQYERDAHEMANDMYMQWLKGGEFGLIIPKPVRVIYTLYNEPTAKYKNISVFEMAKPIFKQLKNKHNVTQNS